MWSMFSTLWSTLSDTIRLLGRVTAMAHNECDVIEEGQLIRLDEVRRTRNEAKTKKLPAALTY